MMSIFTSFTNLPAEVRNIIYDELCTDGLAVLRTCTLVHQEAASYYYQRNPFTVSLPAVHSKGATILPPMADRYLTYLRQLTLCTSIGRPELADTREVARSIVALTRTGTHLEVLTLVFSSKISPILQTRIDDSVLHDTHPITHALRALLLFDVAKQVRVELENAWFAAGVVDDLRSEFGDRLEVFTAVQGEAFERPLTGHYSLTHLQAFGINEHDAAYLQRECLHGGSTPSSLGSALSELDVFSPMEFFDEEPMDVGNFVRIERADSGFGELIFDMDEAEPGMEVEVKKTGYLHMPALDDEELGESDDVDDEEMEGMDGIDAIVGNLEELEVRRVNEEDVCYMVNFAPELMGRWPEESV
ncbi:uncharacterized protein EKO05_0010723 [Ascochyta rabiei]|uniref:Uncharacterized protein n=1 Tax=Didymella rabiei TaxID=5454 RepID=A0A163L1R5_DIDRA|nr:uncharacterized protein EKO05_0010723 [Ascochyta rabiei]KZM27433.1 hypothetical protein ST47_g1429 [Ascochyta rabiei]UPX20493.1 hypothetical protein EKO05_0010723 [Ascochyta rabiei]